MAGKVQEAMYKRRRQVWRDIIHDLKGQDGDDVAQARLQMLDRWHTEPWNFFTARDVLTMKDIEEGRHEGAAIIQTADELDDAAPVKPFPSWPYLKHVSAELWSHRFVFADKTRQILITTICALNILWYAAFKEEREVFVSRVKEESAVKLINDKIRSVHRRMPFWLREAIPMDLEPAKMITFGNTNSTITGVSQNFAVSDARGPTASLLLIDEAAFQDFFPQIYRAVVPMTARMWAVSTAHIGNPGAALFKAMIEEGRPGAEQEADGD